MAERAGQGGQKTRKRAASRAKRSSSPSRKSARSKARAKTAGKKKASRSRKASGQRARARRELDDAAGAAFDPTSLADLIHRMSRYLSDVTLEDLRRFGMTLPRWSVLTQLTLDDGQSIGDLARTTVIKQSSLTRVVDQMERDALVRRRPARADHRIVEVWLTKKGRETYDEVVPLAVRRLHEAMAGLRGADVEGLRSVFEDVLGDVRGDRR